MFKPIPAILLFLWLAHGAAAEPPPNSDIVVFDVSKTDVTLSAPKVFAASPGYDNQPCFADDSKSIYFTRIEGENSDLWVWSPDQGEQNLTGTVAWSEYSPNVVPGARGLLSTVVVEEDQTQRLWTFSKYAGFQVLFPLLKPVGYHAWSNENIAFFVLGEPHELQVGEWGSDSTRTVDRDIGRCLQRVPGRDAVSYTRLENGRHRLMIYDFGTLERRELRLLPPGVQDYVWLDSRQILTWDGSSLVRGQARSEHSWRRVSSPMKLKDVTRLALSPDRKRLAVVYQP